MLQIVSAEVEIIGFPALNVTSVSLTQKFNQHHEFSIRVSQDMIHSANPVTLESSKELVGEYAIIRFNSVTDSSRTSNEFKGIIFEVSVKSTPNGTELLIRGYSPTILLEDGAGYASYELQDVGSLFLDASKNFDQSGCSKQGNPSNQNLIRYVCRYKESNFHFINRLSADYGELFYYDGKQLIFGTPPVMEFVEVISGVDVSNMQLSLRAAPLDSRGYAYNQKTHEHFLMQQKASKIQGLDPYPKHLVNVSSTLFPEQDDVPINQLVETNEEATTFFEKNQEALAAGLVVLSGSSNNADLGIGKVADVKISLMEDGPDFMRQDFGAYLVTSITHHYSQSGSYYNTFEALSGWVRGVPVKNIISPLAEPQFGVIVDVKDPEKLSRVRVQMQWQTGDEKTDWIWVMTPDAGAGKDGSRGGGLMVLPEKGDFVLVGFVRNNPDLPFVMGSFYHGKNAPDGSVRSLTGRKTSAKVSINDGDGSISIVDGKGHKIILDGAGNINMESNTTISIKVGSSEIKIEPAKITIKATDVKIDATTADIQGSSKAVLKKDDGTYFKAEGSIAEMKATTAEVTGVSEAKLSGNQAKVNGTASAEVKAAQVKIN